MWTTVVFRSTTIVLCDLAAVAFGAWILWNSSEASVISGPSEDKLLFLLAVATILIVRHAVARASDSGTVRKCTTWVVLAADLLLTAVSFIAWKLTTSYYLGWFSTFALLFLLVATGLQVLVDVVTARHRHTSRRRRSKRTVTDVNVQQTATFATEVTRLLGMGAAFVGLILVAPVHGWDVGFLNPLILMISFAIGLSILPYALTHTRLVSASALSADLNFSGPDREPQEAEVVSTEAERAGRGPSYAVRRPEHTR